MNSEDCGMTAAEEYMYIAALIAVVSLFRIHCHMAHTVLEISHSLSNQVRISFNLANFCLVAAGDLPDSLLHPLHRCPFEWSGASFGRWEERRWSCNREEGEARRCFWNGDDGEERRWFCNGEDQKRERRDGGFGMEMMERRGGGFVMEKIRRGRDETVVLEWR